MSRLSPMFLLWLLLLLAAAPASAVMDVQPRNHAWEPPASSYDLAPDVRDGPNLYAYVKQNPWTAWDPHGLSAFSDLQESAANDIANGSSVKGYSKAVAASLWNAFSFGNAERTGGIEDAARDGDMSLGQAAFEAGKGTAVAVKDAALTYGTGGAVLKLATKYDKAETAIDVVSNIAEGDYAGAAMSIAGEVSPGGKGAKKTNAETQQMTGGNAAKTTLPKGARTEPADLQEKLALDEARGGAGEPYRGKLGDPKYDPKTGTHDKRQFNHDHGDGTSTEVHYDVDRTTGQGSGYKIKDDTNATSRGYRYPGTANN